MHIPTMAPGMLVQWWTDGSQEPVAKLFTGEHCGREAKRFVMGLMEKTSSSIRVMAVVDLFQCTGGTQRLCPDQRAPALDLMLREQALGRGFQVQRRGPPKKHPTEHMQQVQDNVNQGKEMTDAEKGYTHAPAQTVMFPPEPAGPPQAPRNRGGEP